YLDTNYRGKAEGLLKALERDGCNFVFLHVESPDESGHEGNIEHKIKAIEDFDREVVGPVAEGMERYEDYTILLMPDHPTPIALRTHSSDPVPFCVYSSKNFNVEGYKKDGVSGFSEEDAGKTGLFVPEAHRLLGYIVKRGIDRKG
ncbi:MAG TPA: phosphoglycerate mutase, partial [Spirochaetes bacterium]|nr:phosphoglycerate mutase [Spirochaetota bacterium]